METTKAGPRQRILETALHLFYEQGYLATGVNQIIEQAGVAKASFYQHFPAKEELGVAYLKERHLIWMRMMEEELEKETSPIKKCMVLFDFLEYWLKKSKYRGCAFLNVASEIPEFNNEMRQVVTQHKEELRDVFKGLAKELKRSSGKYKHLTVQLIADALYILFEGSINACQTLHAAAPVESARHVFLALLKTK